MENCDCLEKLCSTCHHQLLQNELQLRAKDELIAQLQMKVHTLEEELCQFNEYYYAPHKVLCNKNMDQVLKMILGNLHGVDLCRASKVCKLWNGLAQAGLASMKKWVTGRGVSKHCKQLLAPDGTKFRGCCMAISKRHVFTQSDISIDFNIYVFCTETGNYLHQLVAPANETERVDKLFLTKEDTVAIASYVSPVLPIWNTDTGELLHTLQLPNTVWPMAVHDFRLACSFRVDDHWSVVVFNIDSGHSVRVNVGDEFAISEFDVGVRHVVAVDQAQDPVQIKLWDIDTRLCRFTWPADNTVNIVMVDDETQRVVGMGWHAGLAIWDTETGLLKVRLPMITHWSPRTLVKKSPKLYIHHLESEFQHITIALQVVDLRSGEVLDTEVRDGTVRGRKDPCAFFEQSPILLPNDLMVTYGGIKEDDNYIDLWDLKKMVYVRQICESRLDIYQFSASSNQLQYVGLKANGPLKLVRFKFG